MRYGVAKSLVKLSAAPAEPAPSSPFLTPERAKLLAGAAVGGLAGLTGIAAMSPHLRAQAKFMMAGKKTQQALDKGSAVPESVAKEVDDLINHLQSMGIDPAKARVGVTGAGGTGKSTFAKEFARRTGAVHNALDDIAPTVRDGFTFKRDFSGVKFVPGGVYEQSHLLTEVDPKNFDVLVHLETPHDVVKKNLLKRKRGAYQEELWDYKKFQNVLREAFDSAGGTAQEFSGGRIRVRTPGGGQTGFADSAQYLSDAQKKFGRPDKIQTRQDAILSNTMGKAKKHKGLQSYVKKTTPAKAFAGGTAGAALGAGGTYGAMEYGNRKDHNSVPTPMGVKVADKGSERSKNDKKIIARSLLGGAAGTSLAIGGTLGATHLSLRNRRHAMGRAWRKEGRGASERVAALLNYKVLSDPDSMNRIRRLAARSAMAYTIPLGFGLGAAVPNLKIKEDAEKSLKSRVNKKETK